MKKISTLFKGVILSVSILCFAFTAFSANILNGSIGTFDGAYGIDFNNDGTAEFYIRDAGFEVTHTNAMLMFQWSEGGNNIWTNGTLEAGGWDDIKPITAGTSIGASANWEAQGDAYIVNYYDETLFSAGTNYVGFRIKINGNTHYGWAKVNVSGSASAGYQIEWVECAYETTPNTAIAAGNTGTGIRENTVATVVSPNPTSDFVRIQTSITNNTEVVVCDLSGKTVNAPVSLESEQIVVNLSGLSNGIYFVKFDDKTVKVLKK